MEIYSVNKVESHVWMMLMLKRVLSENGKLFFSFPALRLHFRLDGESIISPQRISRTRKYHGSVECRLWFWPNFCDANINGKKISFDLIYFHQAFYHSSYRSRCFKRCRLIRRRRVINPFVFTFKNSPSLIKVAREKLFNGNGAFVVWHRSDFDWKSIFLLLLFVCAIRYYVEMT